MMQNVMRAVQVQDWGAEAHLEEIPRPIPAAGEILVKVHAAGVNPVDFLTRDGYLKGRLAPPLTLGWDVAGEVVEFGEGTFANGLQVGDEVFAMIYLRGGAFADYAIVKPEEIAKKPQSLDMVHAAALPLVALTAYQALEVVNPQPGQRVLIHAASGGVGGIAVQLAKLRGAYVIGTASGKNETFVHDLGVDEFVDYTKAPFEQVIQNVDVVVDTVGGETLTRSYQVLKPGGKLITMVGQPDPKLAQQHDIQALRFDIQPDAEQLAEIANLFDAAKLQVMVSQCFPLEQTREALEQSETGHVHGKIVITI
jgi:NADPH:quinone reductase-like Zn-dependent oxidoreductase